MPAFSALRGATAVRIPLVLEENHGQADPRALFLARATSGTFYLTENGIVFGLRGRDLAQSVQLHFVHTSAVKPVASSPQRRFRKLLHIRESEQMA